MEQRTLGSTGLNVSVLGFGGAPIGFLEVEQQRVGQILTLLLDNGVNLIDTAASYAGSEEVIGQTIGDRRDDFVLVSKCGQAFAELPGEAWSPEVITATVDRALRRLQTDHLDVMLLHSCSREVLEKGDALAALVAAREAGKIRFCGYSGDNETAAYALTLPDIAVLETSVNMVDQANLELVLPTALERNVGVIVKRPLANSVWRGVSNLPGMYQSYARQYAERFEAMGVNLADLGLGDAKWAEAALRFTLTQPGVTVAIVGTTNPDNARQNLAAADAAPLPEAAVKALREAFAKGEAASGDRWPALT